MYLSMYLSMYLAMYLCIYVSMYLCMYDIYIYTYTYTYVYEYALTFLRVRTLALCVNIMNSARLTMNSLLMEISLFIDAQLLIDMSSAGCVSDHFGSNSSVLIEDQCSSSIVVIGGRVLSRVSLGPVACYHSE